MLIFIFVGLLLAGQIQAKAVFAHFMVTNAANYTSTDAENDISLAQDAHIDAFALNMANADPANDAVVSMFFKAAISVGFQLFFSFDYAGNGAWDKDDVIDFIDTYGSSSAYYQYNGQPFVSTFEGPASSDDWITIKASTGCFFIPDWSSLGAKVAVDREVADGLFSWAAWPWGDEEMNTYGDASYMQYLGDLPYMMPASPWFYTNLPGYSKNWLWRGDNLWYDRWQQILFIQPPFVEIISWNDYGESHYIGPLRDYAMAAFTIGEAPFNYVTDMPHDGWRLFLPYLIDTYKNGVATITNEALTVWHRPQPAQACSSGGTSGNTASQLQIEFLPTDIVEDRIFYSALLSSSATVTVSIGSVTMQGTWDWEPDGGIGIYHGSVLFGSNTGDVVVTVSRSGSQIAQVTGSSITTTCTDGLENWNAWVGSYEATTTISATPTLSLFDQTCINGTGTNNFAGICEFGCEYGYCPIGACYCHLMGAAKTQPSATGAVGYPLAGEDASYSGLCAFDCAHGYCPDTACGTASAALSTPTVSDFTPPACISGSGEDNLAGLCSFSCNYGFCPINACECTAEGVLNTLPTKTSQTGTAAAGLDKTIYGPLCQFACEYGYCPEGACTNSTSSTSGSGSGSGVVFIDPIIFGKPSPVVGCIPPCTLVMPLSTMNTPTTIYFSPISTSLVIGTSTITTIVPSPVTTSIISYFSLPIASSQTDPFSFRLTPSYSLAPVSITADGTTTTLYLNPIVTPSIVSQVAATFTSLGQTTYVSDGKTQTFSQAQDTALRTLTSATQITTSFPETVSGTSTSTTTTVVPVWIQIGGFYWSPVPEATPTPIEIPTLPEYPPIPSADCFTLFDIFSIDCPPNKYLPTTTFYSESPQPTCTGSGCGELCTSNCETSTTSECEAETATDYWVTCSGTSCTTTRTATVTGCSVTNSATTTGSYCPTPVSITPDDSQDGDGPSKTAMTTKTTTIGETAIVSGTFYPVETSSITVSGATISVPIISDDAVSTTTIDGYPMTIVGGYTGVVSIWVYPTTSTSTSTTEAGTTTTTTLPPTTITVTVTPTPTSYNCKGSSECGTYAFLNTYCGEAADKLVDSEVYGTTNEDSDTGACYTPLILDGCGVFVQGTACEFTGAEIKAAAADIANIGGCGICGNAFYSNGCRVTIDYVSGCES